MSLPLINKDTRVRVRENRVWEVSFKRNRVRSWQVVAPTVEALIEAVAEATEIVRAKLNAVREHERRERLSKCLRMGIEADLHAYFRRDEVSQRRYPRLSYAEARFLQGCCKRLKIRVEVEPSKTLAEAFTLQHLRRLRVCLASSLRRKWAKLRREKEI